MTTVETSWPLSIWQRQCMTDEQTRPGVFTDPYFTINAVVDLDQPLNLVVLQRALDELLRRHELLRTRFAEDAQVVAPQVAGVIEQVDEVALHFPVPADSPTPLVLTVSGNKLSLHLQHLACDPPTVWAALTELAALYTAELGGPAVPPPSAQFGEYVVHELEQERVGLDAARAWWQSSLGGKRFARVRPDAGAEGFEYRGEVLSANDYAALERLARTHRGTAFTTMFAALACAMGPRMDGGDLIFSTVFRKRDRPQWQRMLGPCFAPTFVAIPAPPAELTADYSRVVRDVLLKSQRHNRFDLIELRGLSPDMAESTTLRTFFELIPAERPIGLVFGPATGRVAEAAGPLMRITTRMSVRARNTEDGSVVGHVSGGPGGWQESTVRQLWRDVAGMVRSE
ncbi:condensation domain-containing protein [Kutzneria sp. CA-103260]|uniref:condensation domain-containing protein n=1 Tax=Kutzneria sp. CA-103260 TaxID=2802641 RepID=UPI001BAB8A7C|nr:condensation domain-containing protein [Kutzneria sp. CA-103260]QUQ68562.1 non-ribosomal peptide synthetase [Kutzneria sp. CA-103260]